MRDKGPLINNIKKKSNNRDPLGIQGVSQSIVGELCPVINSVTPHALYWIFINWVYYDVYINRKITNLSSKILNKYIKIYNYFIVIGNIINGQNITNMVGTKNIKKIIDYVQEDDYSYDDKYLDTLTGINYYRAALNTAGLITGVDLDGNEFQHFKFTEKGTTLAKSFDVVIKQTKFYKEYAITDNFENIPYNVIKELGKYINFDLKNLEKAKSLLKKYFFESLKKLQAQEKFIKYLYYDLGIKNINENDLRYYLYDNFSPRSYNNKCPNDLIPVIRGWELLIGRHFFTCSIEMIFTYILEKLNNVIYIDLFIDNILKNIQSDKLFNMLNKYNLNGVEIDALLSNGKNKRLSHESNIINSLKILCSLYNRFNHRDDLRIELLLMNNYGASISLMQMIEDIEKYKDKEIKEYLRYVIKKYVIEQHIKTAERKWVLEEDSYFFGYDDNYIYKIEKKEYSYDYQNLRINQLFNVMKELDMLGDK